MKTGDMIPEGKNSAPAEAKKVIFSPPPMPVKDGLPMKMSSSAETDPAVKPEPKAVKKDEPDLSPMPVKSPEPAPMESHPAPPVKPERGALPDAAPPAPAPDLTLPPSPSAPALDEKTPMQPLVEPAGDSKGEPDVPLPPPYTPPSK
jgi:hypothetical protein